MALIELGAAFLGALLAEIVGDDKVSWFARRGFATVAIWSMGVRVSTLTETAAAIWGVIP